MYIARIFFYITLFYCSRFNKIEFNKFINRRHFFIIIYFNNNNNKKQYNTNALVILA